jgi:uncharacterized membrane protein
MDEARRDAPGAQERFEDYPLTRLEYINVMVHFYRGEVSRSTAWRARLDATTNWAVLTTAGMLSFSFTSADHPHIVLLLTNLIIIAYLVIEARRFRYFVVYRSRVRMLEENFLIPILTRQLESPMARWREMLAMDLDLPKYKTTFVDAMAFRLRRNYVWIFLMVLGGWCVKLSIHPSLALTAGELWGRIGVGPLSAGIVVAGAVVFYGALTALMLAGRRQEAAPEDEIAGLERNLEQWKR